MPGPMPRPMPGQMPGAMPGMMPGAMPGMMPGVMPGVMPRMMPRTGPIPGVRPSAAPVNPSVAPGGPEYGEEGEGEGGMPMGGMEQIRARLMQDPAYLQQFLQELQVANPQLFQVIQQNPQVLMQLLMGGGQPRPRGGIQVTAEEKAAIDRVIRIYLISS